MDFADKIPPETPCETCRVDLLEENEEAAICYMQARGKGVTVGERVVDLSIPAVKILMELAGVKNHRECMNKVFSTFHYFLNKQRKECE